MNIQWLLGWWNLIFLVPFLLALVYLGVYTATGLDFGSADADAGGDVDADADADVDVDADADVGADANVDADVNVDTDADVAVDADAHAEVDADTDADADAHGDGDGDGEAHHGSRGGGGRGSPLAVLLAPLGVGKVPLSMIAVILLLTWGGIGFLVNSALGRAGWAAAIVSLPVAAVGSVALTGSVARLVARYLPMNETYARRRNHLLGRGGVALFPIDGRFGMALVRGERGERFQVECRAEPDHAPIPKGSPVLMVGYDAKRRIFTVIPDVADDDDDATTGLAPPRRDALQG